MRRCGSTTVPRLSSNPWESRNHVEPPLCRLQGDKDHDRKLRDDRRYLYSESDGLVSRRTQYRQILTEKPYGTLCGLTTSGRNLWHIGRPGKQSGDPQVNFFT